MTCKDFIWGYYCESNGKVYIPFLSGAWKLSEVLEFVYEKTGNKRMVFSAVLNPPEFRKHLHNIVEERREWSELHGDYSYCIEIEYQPREVSKCSST